MKRSKLMGVAAIITLLSASPLLADDDAGGADWEVSGIFKNETAIFTRSGPTIGELQATNAGIDQDGGDLLKFENSLNLFINGTFTDDTSLHAQFNLVYDTEGINGFRSHEWDTQNDILRELYVDTTAGPLDLRIGKQQVVWGTADGIKLLDIVNPTDWREFVQNTMEDSRIPVWMIKAEADVGESGNIQFIVAQRHENAIPGMDQDGDVGQPFKMLGVDSITGPVNGFLNVVPEMGTVSNAFWNMFGGGGNLAGNVGTTVNAFANAPDSGLALGGAASGIDGTRTLSGVAYAAPPNGVGGKTNLIDATSTATWNTTNPTSVFEYMPNTTFATFDAFVNATTEYRRDYPDELDPNLGFRVKSSVGNNFNYSMNYLWHYDANPYVEMHWEGPAGEMLQVNTAVAGGLTTVSLTDAATGLVPYGGAAGSGMNGLGVQVDPTKTPSLVFTEKLNRIHSLGTAFDYAMDTKATGPIVLRGEFLYQVDTKVPVIDRTKLGYGDLVGAMRMEDADMFKYVLGADSIFFTNLMVSGQFIQFVNLDYIDDTAINRYTADPTVMHMSNGLKKAEEFKEFYSIFFSKPFGEEQQGRWNNIFMVEEGGGYWNRFDVEYSFTDELVATTEYNAYFGDEDTMFGQFEKSSNIQVGFKYIF
jgi:hypothetical protein